jgi:hypothetical protein
LTTSVTFGYFATYSDSFHDSGLNELVLTWNRDLDRFRPPTIEVFNYINRWTPTERCKQHFPCSQKFAAKSQVETATELDIWQSTAGIIYEGQ